MGVYPGTGYVVPVVRAEGGICKLCACWICRWKSWRFQGPSDGLVPVIGVLLRVAWCEAGWECGVGIGDEAQRKGVEVDLRSKACCLVVG